MSTVYVFVLSCLVFFLSHLQLSLLSKYTYAHTLTVVARSAIRDKCEANA